MMSNSNLETLRRIVRTALNLDENEYVDDIKQITCADWDSVAQISILTGVESEFSLRLNSSQIQRLISFEGIRLVLVERGVL